MSDGPEVFHGHVVVRQGDLGRGIVARSRLRAGQTILEFDGAEYSHEQVLAMGDAQAYTIQVAPDRYIDTCPPGRFTNHSCEPNAGVVGDRILVALRDILPGEEIRFDYSTTMSENHWTMLCRCGRPGCRRIVRDFHDLPAPLQERYIGLGIVQSFIVREWRARRESRRGLGRVLRFGSARRATGA